MFLRDELCRLGNDPVIVAWGVNIDPDREVEILTIASRSGADLRCWEITQDGFPGHPLYLSNAKMDSPISFGLSVPVDIS
jgi:hypothetical protein